MIQRREHLGFALEPGEPFRVLRERVRLGRFLSGHARATVLRAGEPTFLRLGNIWLTINGGGGGTDDKPEVVAEPPRDPNVLSNF
jgi:hypothetical protein